MSNDDDLSELLAHVGELQSNLASMQAASAAQHLEGSAGNGAVRVVMTGNFDVVSVKIDPVVVDPAATDLLEDLLVAALRDTSSKVNGARQEAVNAAMGSAMASLLDPTSTLTDAERSPDADSADE